MSDTWSNIQAHKKQLDSLRERLQRRRKDPTQLGIGFSSTFEHKALSFFLPWQVFCFPPSVWMLLHPGGPRPLKLFSDYSLKLFTTNKKKSVLFNPPENPVEQACVESLLLKFAAQELIEVRPLTSDPSRPPPPTLVTSADHPKLWAMRGAVTSNTASLGELNTAVHAQPARGGVKRKGADLESSPAPSSSAASYASPAPSSSMSSSRDPPALKKSRGGKVQASDLHWEIENLLSQQSTKEQQSKKVSREILELLNTSTAKEQSIVEKFRSRGRAQVQEFCDQGTKEECVRACEGGPPCRKLHFSYERADEIIWVKTNQLQRIIRTGRTGHWLNHGKEHCLVGVKGSPQGFNRGLDCDVIVAEVRSTSHKPDEIYGMIERLSPGTRKIELFGRPHNVQPNWVTLGNQLDGIHLLDPDVVSRFKKRYPDGVISKPKNM
ncbi:MTA70 methyltransferase, partial [Polyodon spathula]|nr:MTA70 methyltransferase [Polyodon spathula]